MSPTLFFKAFFLSCVMVSFNGVGALPSPVVTVVKSGNSASAVVVASTPSTKTVASATVIASSSTSASAAISTSTNISPLGSSTDVFTQGQACKASWIPAASTSSIWKNMTIHLMTGSNLQMNKLATVAMGLDGTSSTDTSYEYSCPDVSPNAPIFFLQYTHDDGLDPMWTTRFTIANDAGIWQPAPEANQPEGGSPAVPWGQGELVVTTTTFNSASAQVKTSHSGVSSNSNGNTDSTSNTSSSSSASGNLASFQSPAFSAIIIAVVVASLL